MPAKEKHTKNRAKKGTGREGDKATRTESGKVGGGGGGVGVNETGTQPGVGKNKAPGGEEGGVRGVPR